MYLEEFRWVLICFGITFILTKAHITAYFRDKMEKAHPKLGELFHCPLCTGFWVGASLGLFWQSPTGNLFLDAVYGSSTAFLLFCISWKLALGSGKV